MHFENDKICSSRRTCFVFNAAGDQVGKIQFQQDRNFKVWRIKYLSVDLPVHSYDRPEDVREKLLDLGYTWSWGEIRHKYSRDIR